MKTLVFKNANNQLRVEYKVDLFSSSDNFTIMEIAGLDDAEKQIGISFKELASDGLGSGAEDPTLGGLENFKQFATDNNLILEEIDNENNVVTELVALGTALNITTTTLPGGNVSVAYDEDVVAVGGNGVRTFAVTSGSLPNLLTLNASTGKISGTPDTVENPSFDITVTDGFGVTDVQSLSIDIAA